MDEMSEKTLDELDTDKEMQNARRIEAALFISGRFLSVPELVALTDVNPILLKKSLGDLQERYGDSGIDIVEEGGKWKMDVAGEFADLINRLATGESEFSKAEQETLAILAYKKQMKQSMLVKIRGNKAYDHVKRFVEMGLVNKKKMGHTADLSLSDRFHEYFTVSGETVRPEDLEEDDKKSSDFHTDSSGKEEMVEGAVK